MEDKSQNEVEKKPEDVKEFEHVIGRVADDVKQMTFRYYFDTKAQGWCVTCDEYPNHAGQGVTKREALQTWTELFAKILHYENPDEEYTYQVK